MIESNNIKSNWEYRRYLTKNSKDILEYNFRESCNDVGYFKRPIDLPSIQSNVVNGTNGSPFLYDSIIDKSKPTGYEDSDLKQIYLTREQLDARKIAPVVHEEKLKN